MHQRSNPHDRRHLHLDARKAAVGAVGTAALALASIGPLAADDDTRAHREVSPPIDEVRTTATGPWGGARSELSENGVVLHGSIVWDLSSAVHGVDDAGLASRALADFGATVDLDRAIDWRGATFHAGVHAKRGSGQDERLGDFQSTSNIDARRFEQVAELWIEQTAVSGAFRLKAGRVDANSEFAYVDAAGEFLNASAGFSPAIASMPTYPDPAWSVSAFGRPAEAFEIGVGVFESPNVGRDGGTEAFGIAEARFGWSGERPGRIGVGAWRDEAPLERFDGRPVDGTDGWYATVEQELWRRPLTTRGAERSVHAFGQVASSDGAVAEAERHFGVGLVVTGLTASRDGDVAGFYWTKVDLSDDPAAGFAEDESVVEVFHGFRVLEYLRLKPNVQHVRHPGGDPDTESAWVVGLRFELSL